MKYDVCYKKEYCVNLYQKKNQKDSFCYENSYVYSHSKYTGSIMNQNSLMHIMSLVFYLNQTKTHFSFYQFCNWGLYYMLIAHLIMKFLSTIKKYYCSKTKCYELKNF